MIFKLAFKSIDAHSSRHVGIAFGLIVLVSFTPEIMSELWGRDVLVIDVIGFAITVMFLIVEIVLLMFSAVRGKFGEALSCGLAVVLLALPIMFPRNLLVAVQHVKLFVLHHKYELSAKSSVEYEDSKRFKLCSFRSDGNSFAMIVYDSGGQIDLPMAQRSREFDSVIGHQSPILDQCRTSAARIRGDFYFAQSVC